MNYTELQTLVANYLDRADLSSDVPGFIARCENKLNRKLRLREQNQISTGPYTNGSRFVELPDGFVEMLNLIIKPSSSDDDAYETPRFVSPVMLTKYYKTETATPKYYTLRDQIEFNCEVSDAHTMRMYYLKKWDIATDTTNWLLTNYEDAYLYGSLMEAEAFIKNDERVPGWKILFDEVMTQLNELDERSQDDAILGTDVYLLNGNWNRGWNIING